MLRSSCCRLLRRPPAFPAASGTACAALRRAAPRRLLCTEATASEQGASKSWFLAWCENNPITLGVGVATLKTQAADLLTQKSLEGKAWADIDWRRNGLFTIFGFAYQGCFQYYLYVTLFSRWFAGAARFANQPFAKKLTDYQGQLDVLKQCAFDCFVHPVWFFPMYYTLKEALTGHPSVFDGIPMGEITSTALNKYWGNNFDPNGKEGLLADFTAFWKIWILGDIVV